MQWTSFAPDKPSTWNEAQFAEFAKESSWVFAKTMPRNPHEYTLRSNAREGQFVEAVRFIREHGSIEEYRRKPYKVLRLGNHMYWTMGSSLEETALINRKCTTA